LIRAIRSLRRPVGIFCYNDYVATDIVDVCIEADLNVPEQVAVVGVDNDPVLCDCTHVPLSSVRHDLEGMAYEAAALLDRLMDGKAPPVTPKLIAPIGVVTRKSTDMLAVEHPEVAKALRFIQSNFSRTNLSVGSIVEAGKLPRRSLEMAFRNELNRSILSEILRVRLKHAQNLLQTTEFANGRCRYPVRICESEPFFPCLSHPNRNDTPLVSSGFSITRYIPIVTGPHLVLIHR
jgi:LacI family transcriptional regulator